MCEFVYGLVAKLQKLTVKDGGVDEVALLRAIYIFAVTWKPRSGNPNFVHKSWGLQWTGSVSHFRKMQKLLSMDPALDTIRGYTPGR